MARMNVKEYVNFVNNQEGGLMKLTCTEDQSGIPIRISIRFKAEAYDLHKIDWRDFKESAEEASKLYAFIITDERMFHVGIMEIALKMMNYRQESEDAAEAIAYTRRILKEHKKFGY